MASTEPMTNPCWSGGIIFLNKDWIPSWAVGGTIILFFIHIIGYLVYSLGWYIAIFFTVVPAVDCTYNSLFTVSNSFHPDSLPRGAREKKMRLVNP
jgi:hypothetical protein